MSTWHVALIVIERLMDLLRVLFVVGVVVVVVVNELGWGRISELLIVLTSCHRRVIIRTWLLLALLLLFLGT